MEFGTALKTVEAHEKCRVLFSLLIETLDVEPKDGMKGLYDSYMVLCKDMPVAQGIIEKHYTDFKAKEDAKISVDPGQQVMYDGPDDLPNTVNELVVENLMEEVSERFALD